MKHAALRKHAPKEHRRFDRVKNRIPVTIDNRRGFTRDISPSGVYLEMEGNMKPGVIIRFKLELMTLHGVMNLSCDGQVVRVEDLDGKVGIATKILSQTIVPIG